MINGRFLSFANGNNVNHHHTISYLIHQPITWRLKLDFVAIRGGDPLHPQNIADILKLVQRVRAECPGKDIWVWTGYKIDELNAEQMEVVNLINVLVDGKFVQDLKDPRGLIYILEFQLTYLIPPSRWIPFTKPL